MPRHFPALPGFYQALFLYLEPRQYSPFSLLYVEHSLTRHGIVVTTISPAFLAWFFPGAEWFHAQLIPVGTPSGTLDARTTMAIWQLGNCTAVTLQSGRGTHCLVHFHRLHVTGINILTRLSSHPGHIA